ncbi:HEAT repeat domain-containing protein [Paenibacillus cellulosilyticus]|uniref:HEAT repeat domain-containing protein n=1 Tax=Paenibacillus cellulosilyticus TaxID=375489 RepID=UPI00158014F4|nr:HEAT repeat domain-containing protein [Paenibacillus cellulosilyticus]QKS44939.1 HEAT repeat domain-containing protein [Paenibacillus cellulosilyticus]QKS44944.1 HEAT repeat domain-containing protein [Paenibacillus cellulosilyticus]
MTEDILIQLIRNNEIDNALKLIEDLGNNKDSSAAPFLIELLTTTEDHLIRNKTAIALSDLGCEEAVEPIFKLLKDPKTLGYRGSLLYALEPLNYLGHEGILFDFIITGNFEVSRHSFQLLEMVKDKISPELKQEYKCKMNEIIDELEDKIEFLKEAIDDIEM